MPFYPMIKLKRIFALQGLVVSIAVLYIYSKTQSKDFSFNDLSCDWEFDISITKMTKNEIINDSKDIKLYDCIVLSLDFSDKGELHFVDAFINENKSIPVLILTKINEASFISRAIQMGVQEILFEDHLDYAVFYKSIIVAVNNFNVSCKNKTVGERFTKTVKNIEGTKFLNKTLANVTHEIRTPLNSLVGMTEALSETQLSEEQSIYLGLIRKAGNNILRYVNNILQIEKVCSVNAKSKKSKINIHQLLSDICQILSLSALKQKNKLSFKVDRQVPRQIIGDGISCSQILTNLIGNAIKFTQNGKINVAVNVLHQRDKQLEIKVSDTGIGIEPDKLEVIFEPFIQADEKIYPRFGGTGLGLSIVKNLVKEIGGKIIVESEFGSGAKFILTIPFEMCESFNDNEYRASEYSTPQDKIDYKKL